MSEVSFTPGPWKWSEHSGCCLYGSNGELIAFVTGGDISQSPIDAANARLIAAAPDLYEALKTVVDIRDNPNATSYLPIAVDHQARKALAKMRSPQAQRPEET